MKAHLPYGVVLAALLVLVGCWGACAEESEEAGSRLYGAKPEYTHVVLNGLPLYGLGISALGLFVALFTHSTAARNLALLLTVVAAGSALPTFQSGHEAYSEVHHLADEPGKDWLDEHMDRAEKGVYVFYAAAALALLALLLSRHFPKTSTSLAIATLATSIAALGFGIWIGSAGGRIRHVEFRPGAPAATPAPETAPQEHPPPATP